MLFYIIKYVCFIKASNKSPIPHLISNDIDYFIINKLLTEDVLFSLFGK